MFIDHWLSSLDKSVSSKLSSTSSFQPDRTKSDDNGHSKDGVDTPSFEDEAMTAQRSPDSNLPRVPTSIPPVWSDPLIELEAALEDWLKERERDSHRELNSQTVSCIRSSNPRSLVALDLTARPAPTIAEPQNVEHSEFFDELQTSWRKLKIQEIQRAQDTSYIDTISEPPPVTTASSSATSLIWWERPLPPQTANDYCPGCGVSLENPSDGFMKYFRLNFRVCEFSGNRFCASCHTGRVRISAWHFLKLGVFFEISVSENYCAVLDVLYSQPDFSANELKIPMANYRGVSEGLKLMSIVNSKDYRKTGNGAKEFPGSIVQMHGGHLPSRTSSVRLTFEEVTDFAEEGERFRVLYKSVQCVLESAESETGGCRSRSCLKHQACLVCESCHPAVLSFSPLCEACQTCGIIFHSRCWKFLVGCPVCVTRRESGRGDVTVAAAVEVVPFVLQAAELPPEPE